MSESPELIQLNRHNLFALLRHLESERAKSLFLIGPWVKIPRINNFPKSWHAVQVVYCLKEEVPGLAKMLTRLTELRILNLSGNQIGDAGVESLVHLSKLTSLNLAVNRISDVGAGSLSVLSGLTHLDLSNNRIRDAGVASLATLKNLTSLNLYRNEVVDIKPLTSLKQIRTLDLRENMVQDLSPFKPLVEGGLKIIWQSNKEDGINVYECPLVHPPPEIIQQGHEAVLAYLREIDVQGVGHLFEAKVLILGEGGAGKTSLLRRLYRQDLELPKENESTKGIDIHRHEFTNPDGKPFRLNVWDFGGQEIYHNTHQFFLTKRSLYVLVDDTRNNNKTVHDEGFKYWLEVIEALSDSCPVLIFQNEKSNRSKTIDECGIKGRFPNVIDVYKGNLEQPHSARILEDAIRMKVQHLPHVGDAVPTQWVAIRKELDQIKQSQPYISFLSYLQVYNRHLNEDRPRALRLSQYFHDLGIFLHFQDDDILSRTVILQNDWATEAVFKVLDDEPTKARKGYFDRKACRRIWADSTYSDMQLELLALMMKFELCYKLPDQQPDTWLTPQLLPPSIPEELKGWASADDLVLTYQYDFLPKGMINRLMVRMHRYVRDPNLSWGSGAYFEQGSNKLIACISAESGQEIDLRARGPERKTLLSVIASDLDALNSSFEGLRGKVRKLIPCICSQCSLSDCVYKFDEPTLLRAKHSKISFLRCNFSFEEVNVLLLLDGLNLEVSPQLTNLTKMSVRENTLQYCRKDNEGRANVPKTVRIFLASSSELGDDRTKFELYLRQENDRLRSRGINLELICWENFLDAMSETRLQDEYNDEIKRCDIFVSLFKYKTGRYTKEEFNIAHAAFKSTGKPLIYTYFMRAKVPNDRRFRAALNSLWDFQEKLTELGHFYTEYSSIQDLQLQFRKQLDMLTDERKI